MCFAFFVNSPRDFALLYHESAKICMQKEEKISSLIAVQKLNIAEMVKYSPKADNKISMNTIGELNFQSTKHLLQTTVLIYQVNSYQDEKENCPKSIALITYDHKLTTQLWVQSFFFFSHVLTKSNYDKLALLGFKPEDSFTKKDYHYLPSK